MVTIDGLTGDLDVAITNEKNQPVPAQVEDNGDGTYTVAYTPAAPGPLKVNVLYAGKLVPQSPIAVQVQPHVDVSKVKVDGLEPSKSFLSLHHLLCYRGEGGGGPNSRCVLKKK